MLSCRLDGLPAVGPLPPTSPGPTRPPLNGRGAIRSDYCCFVSVSAHALGTRQNCPSYSCAFFFVMGGQSIG